MKTRSTFLGCIAAATILAACGEKGTQQTQVQSVLTDTVRSSAGYNVVKFPGKVKASHDVNLSFRVSGAIKRFCVAEGRLVKAGDVLVEMDPTDYEVQLSATEAEYAQIKAQAERVIALHADGVVADADNDKAVYGLQQIEAKLRHHRDQLAYTKLVAPFDGVVQKKLFAEGEIVGAGMPAIQFISNGSHEVEINIPVAEYLKRDSFDKAFGVADIAPGEQFELQTISISPKANANQLHTMRLRFAGAKNPSVVPGMNVMVSINTKADSENSYALPAGAVTARDGKAFVFVLNAKDNTIHTRNVTLRQLLSNGRRIVVSTEIKEGDVVVAAGTTHLVDGQSVRPIPPVSNTNVGGLL